MTSRRLRARVNDDGTLDLHVATGLPEGEVEVVIVYHPVRHIDAGETKRPEERGWWASFLERTQGSITDPSFEVPEEPAYDARSILF